MPKTRRLVYAAGGGLLLSLLFGCGGPQATSTPVPSSESGTKAAKLPEGPAAAPSVAAYTLQPVAFTAAPAQYRSVWAQRTRSVTVSKAGEGVRAEVVGGTDASGGQYGGVKFPVNGVGALRLTMRFENPGNIEAVFVDGRDAAKDRKLRWKWFFHEDTLPQESDTYVFVPGQPMGYFRAEVNDGGADVKQIDVFLRLRTPGSKASVIVEKAEVAPHQ